MHSYVGKKIILVNGGCYTPPPRPLLNQIQARWFQTSFPGNLSGENTDDSMPAHTEGREWKPLSEDSDTHLEDVGSPEWGTKCANY
jgi:hypothetical protein